MGIEMPYTKLNESKEKIMDNFYWTTEYEHYNNIHTLSEYLEEYLPDGFEILMVDGTYAEITNTESGIMYGVHAQGNGDFRHHMVKFEEIN